MYLYGASGHGKVIKEILYATGVDIQAFIDDNRDIDLLAGKEVLHDFLGLSPIIVSIGVNRVRKMVVDRLLANNCNLEFGQAIHPSAIISPSAKIGEGTVVMPGVVINADVTIGRHCIINTGATIDHDCVIDDYCHIAPGVNISGGTAIGTGSWIGVGTSIIQNLIIGLNCMVGAGSVVVKNISNNTLAYGNPCREVRTIEEYF